MPGRKKKLNILFRLKGIREKGFDLQSDKLSLGEQGKYVYGLNTSIYIKKEETIKDVSIIVEINIFTDPEKKNKFLSFSAYFDFEIKDVNNSILIEDTHVKLPEQLVINMVDIALSTARGILYEKLNNTPAKKAAIFPIVDSKIVAKKLSINSD